MSRAGIVNVAAAHARPRPAPCASLLGPPCFVAVPLLPSCSPLLPAAVPALPDLLSCPRLVAASSHCLDFSLVACTAAMLWCSQDTPTQGVWNVQQLLVTS